MSSQDARILNYRLIPTSSVLSASVFPVPTLSLCSSFALKIMNDGLKKNLYGSYATVRLRGNQNRLILRRNKGPPYLQGPINATVSSFYACAHHGSGKRKLSGQPLVSYLFIGSQIYSLFTSIRL